ncbi:hypothetical protein BGY98DRAFT_1005193 [Russula aff. rugulosa BPL654]|nr:hypothetical protein BGY98DRAFT_1005193 [Russula aff. rugulosa BPL654]
MPSRPGLRAGTGQPPPTCATSSASAWLPRPLLRPSHRGVSRVFPSLLLEQRK